jgi:hypothetical protein
MVSTAVWLTDPWVAVIVAIPGLATAKVRIVNDALLAPEATVTEPGVEASELLDESVITVPPGPAKPFKVTVPVDAIPAGTIDGARVKFVKTAGFTVSWALAAAAPIAALTVAVVEVETG